ncbi:hypothetical protein P691DRAFT_763868 [Macrolepiota fuliginosa MF-IS2]|uniref:F-box domain-containing protein n=1 Tax=Macrolepiota fuliginosa MF-IS2 TaxID=1400762 RepID=A0A9P6BY64_9AGAR|nr:hypothetical protein P691DRAFT_763868 [Macrolepiota fuliginosa MF-IS2]
MVLGLTSIYNYRQAFIDIASPFRFSYSLLIMNKLFETYESLDDAVLIKQEVQRLEGDMAEAFRLFHEKRADILWKLNTLQASTKNVPSEILAHIFMLASNGDCFNLQRMPLRLGGVCSHWRRITLSTPCLWSSLTLCFNEDVDMEKGQQTVMDLLRHYMENVGLTPFALDFRFNRHSQPPKETLDLITSVLLHGENSRKVHALKFLRAPFRWISSFPQFPNLESLKIHEPLGYLDRILVLPLANSPRLRNLILCNLCLMPKIVQNNVEQTQITHISLSQVPADVCISLLVRCPNLAHFEFIHPAPKGMQDVDYLQAYGLVDGPIILHQLEHLRWTHPNLVGGSRLIQIYSRLRFPALRSFRWYASQSSHLDYAALHALVPNLPRATSSLQIFHAQEWDMSFINFIFTRTTAIQHLHLYACDYVTMSNVIVALGQRGAVLGNAYLPQLRKMSIDGIGRHPVQCDKGEAEAQLANQIINTLRVRYRDPTMRFSLHLSRCHGTWTKDMQEAYQELHKERIEMKIWVGWRRLLVLGNMPKNNVSGTEQGNPEGRGVEEHNTSDK